ncbi:MAG: hypothetical protein U9N87_12160 [Planctomycetota bacterium]|nr:hypothetical protein [Planctomycetota bacterium]
MNSTELMTEIGDAYLWLNIPDIDDVECRRDVGRILRVEPLADSNTVNDLVTFHDWRGRMVGHVLAIRKGPRKFARAMIDSLANPHGLAIVPTCAALVLGLANEKPDEWQPHFARLDRSPFVGDVGWSVDKTVFHLGWSQEDPGGYSPNDGKDFAVHLRLFRWIEDS